MISRFFLAGLSYRTAPVELRECLAASGEELRNLLKEVKSIENVDEVVILSTCNRVEYYIFRTGPVQQKIKDFLKMRYNLSEEEIEKHVYFHESENAVRHLFYVAGSLDSMVLGEPQILNQVKAAYSEAVAGGASGVGMSTLFHHAFRVGKRIRTETGIGAMPTSVSHVAVEMAERIFGDLRKVRAAVIGAGEMGTLTVRQLHAHGVEDIVVASRTLAHAEELIEEIGTGRALTYDDFLREAHLFDVIITAAGSPTHILTYERAEGIVYKRKGAPLFIIDISIPRVVSDKVGKLEGVFLYDIDDLEKIADENKQLRLKEAEKARRIVDEEVKKFIARTREVDINDLLGELYSAVRRIVEEEYEELLHEFSRRGEFTQDLKEGFINSLVKKLMHVPATRIKQAAREGKLSEVADIMRMVFAIRRDNGEAEGR